MPGTDLSLDIDGDFVDDGEGGWLETENLEPLVRYQVLDHQGLFFADPDAGSELYAIPRKADLSTMLRIEDAYRTALGVFVSLGLGEDLFVEVSEDQRGRFAIAGSLTDRAAGQIDLTPLFGYGIAEQAA